MNFLIFYCIIKGVAVVTVALAPNATAQEKETDAQPPEEKNVIEQVVHTTTKVIDKTINVVANTVDVPLQVTKNVLDIKKNDRLYICRFLLRTLIKQKLDILFKMLYNSGS